MLSLDPLLARRPAELSGGQRQRVAIGRAIVRTPKLFLFDEPLSNLDAALRVNTRIEIARLHRALAATMIYVTHDQVEAMTLADRIVVLNAGRIEQVGAPMELYNNPANTFVAGFIGSPQMNFLEAGPARPARQDPRHPPRAPRPPPRGRRHPRHHLPRRAPRRRDQRLRPHRPARPADRPPLRRAPLRRRRDRPPHPRPDPRLPLRRRRPPPGRLTPTTGVHPARLPAQQPRAARFPCRRGRERCRRCAAAIPTVAPSVHRPSAANRRRLASN